MHQYQCILHSLLYPDVHYYSRKPGQVLHHVHPLPSLPGLHIKGYQVPSLIEFACYPCKGHTVFWCSMPFVGMIDAAMVKYSQVLNSSTIPILQRRNTPNGLACMNEALASRLTYNDDKRHSTWKHYASLKANTSLCNPIIFRIHYLWVHCGRILPLPYLNVEKSNISHCEHRTMTMKSFLWWIYPI